MQFSKEVLVPNAAKYDQSGEFPWDIVKQAHSLGFMNPSIPEAYGQCDSFFLIFSKLLVLAKVDICRRTRIVKPREHISH